MSGLASKVCPTCGAKFGGRGSADSHRAGEWGTEFPRRCRTEAEMIAGGMWRSQRGVWQGTWTEGGPARANAWQGRGSSAGRGDAA